MEHITPPPLHPPGSQQLQRQKWDLKVSTNLQTRLLLVQDPQSTIKSLQDAIEEDHLAIYPAQGPVKCSTVCAVDYNAAGAERYYPINSKYLLRDALKRDGAEVFAYVELKQKKRKRSLGSHAMPDLLSGAPGQKRPRAAAAASSPSPLPPPQLEGEVRSRTSDLTEGVEGDTETVMLRKTARAQQRKKKHKTRQRAAATAQKAVTHGAAEEEGTGGSQEMQHSQQPQKGAAKTGKIGHGEGSRGVDEEEDKRGTSGAVAPAAPAKAAKNIEARELLGKGEEAPAGKSGKRKRGRSQAVAAAAEGAGARQVPQEVDEDLAEGNGAASRQLQPAADAADVSSPEQGRKKRRKKNRHGSGADSVFLESNEDGDAPSRPQEIAPQPSNAPGAAAAATLGKGGGAAGVETRNTRRKLEMNGGSVQAAADQRSSGTEGRPAAEGTGGEGGRASGVADAGRPEATTNDAALPATLTGKRSSGGLSSAAAGTAKKEDCESNSEEDEGGEEKAGAAAAAGQTASGAPSQAVGGALSESSDSSDSESDSDDEEAPAQETSSQQPWRRPPQMSSNDTSSSGAAGSPSKRGPVQTSAPAAQRTSAADGAELRPSPASGDVPEKPALPSAEPQSSSSSEDESSDESSSSDDEVRPERGNAAGAPVQKQEAPEEVLPKQDALDESDSEGVSDPGFKEEADVKQEEEHKEVKSESEEEAGMKQEAGVKQVGYPKGQAEVSSEDESSEDDDSPEEEDSEAEEQESEEEECGQVETPGDDSSGSPEDESDGASPSDAEVEGGSSKNMAAEDNEFDRLKNEATQKVLDTLADMPDAISMLLAAKSARKKARQNGGTPTAEAAQKEAPSTPVPSDARLASLGEALIRQMESQEQPTQNNAAAVTLTGHPELKPLAEYKGESDLRSALRAALVPLVNHQQGTNHKFAAQVLRQCPKPAWWPLEKWDKNQLDRRWKALEAVYHAVQAQRRSLMGSASSA
ncbi:hypothetical protein COCOBI_15-0810 [Coccomyxa sp. Obi]|nr:hypothetical protein COCOBI_15-0810 [Coccomyxa sp. Obi]